MNDKTSPTVEAVLEVLKTGPLSALAGEGAPGKLEDAFCRRFEVAYAVTYNSGTSALWAALFAAGVRPGDEVIAPAFAPAYAIVPILHFRALPVLADIDPLTLTIAPRSVAERITARTKAVVAVDLAGHPADLEGLRQVLAERQKARGGPRVTLIEDCAQAFGAVYRGNPVGHVHPGEIACFSLQENKNLSAGEGGILLTQDCEFFERACLAGQHPERLRRQLKLECYRRFWETGLGLSLRIHPLAAAIALAGLGEVDERLRRRRENAAYLNARLSELGREGRLGGLAPTHVAPGCVHAYNVQPLFYRAGGEGAATAPKNDVRPSLEDFVGAVQARGVDVDVFPDPVYETALFRKREFFGLGGPWEDEDAGRGLYDRDLFPGAETARRTAFFLGAEVLDGERDARDRVIEAFLEVFAEASKSKQETGSRDGIH